MITMIFGLPGSGKSTALAWMCKQALDGKELYICGRKIASAHKHVITNFPFYGANEFDPDSLGKMDYKDTLFVIDESSMYFDSRNFKSFSEYVKNWATQHRKDDLDIILASQGYSDNDLRIRNSTGNMFYCESFFFDFFRISHIEPFFEIINFQLVSGYRWGKVQYFWGKPIFKLFDTHAKIKSSAVEPVVLIPWDVEAPPARVPLGERLKSFFLSLPSRFGSGRKKKK